MSPSTQALLEEAETKVAVYASTYRRGAPKPFDAEIVTRYLSDPEDCRERCGKGANRA